MKKPLKRKLWNEKCFEMKRILNKKSFEIQKLWNEKALEKTLEWKKLLLMLLTILNFSTKNKIKFSFHYK